MIAKKHWLQITGFGVLALVVILIAVIVYWPAKAPVERQTAGLEAQPKVGDEMADAQAQTAKKPGTETPRLARQKTIEQYEKPDPNAEKLYRIAELSMESGDPSENRYEKVLDCCHLILSEYPNSPEAKKATQLLQEVPDEYVSLYEELARVRARYTSKPKVKKSRPLRRR